MAGQSAEAQQLADPLASAYQRASLRIDQLLVDLQNDPAAFRKRKALIERQKAILADMAKLDAEASEWVAKQLPRVYALGGAGGAAEATGGVADFIWSQVHQEAAQRLATGMYRNLLEATQHVRSDTKKLIRKVGQDKALAAALEGKTARQAGREMARVLRNNGVTAVTYANGAKQTLGVYSEMAIRTTTAIAYNEGTLNGSAEHGTTYWEVFDGPFCGWASHDDRQALGMIVTRDEAAGYPISHPNCRRAFGPRPDILTPKQAKDALSHVKDEQTRAQIDADIRRAGREAYKNNTPPNSMPRVEPSTERFNPRRPNTTLTDAEKKAVYDYAWDFETFHRVNGPLRLEVAVQEKYRPIMKTLDDITTRAEIPEAVTVYRVMDGTPGTLLQQLKPGAVIRDHGYMSTSLDKSKALEMLNDGGDSVIWDIKVPAGQRGFNYGDAIAERPGTYEQHEILFPRDTELRITRVVKGEDEFGELQYTVRAEMVPNAPVGPKPPTGADDVVTGGHRPPTPKPPPIPDPPRGGGLFDGLPTNAEIRKANPGWTTARAERELTRLRIERVPTNEAIRKSHPGWTAARAEKERARLISDILGGGEVAPPAPPPKPPFVPPKPPPRPKPEDIYREVEERLAGRKFAGGRAKKVAREKEWLLVAERHDLTVQEVAELYAEGSGKGVVLTKPPVAPEAKPIPGNKTVLSVKELTDDQLEAFYDEWSRIRDTAHALGQKLPTPYAVMKKTRPNWKLSAKDASAAQSAGAHIKYDFARKPIPGFTDVQSRDWAHFLRDVMGEHLNWVNDEQLYEIAKTYSLVHKWLPTDTTVLRQLHARGIRLMETDDPTKVRNWIKYNRPAPRADVVARAQAQGARVPPDEWKKLQNELGRQYDRVPEAASNLKGVDAFSHEEVQFRFSGSKHEGRVLAYYTPSEQKITMSQKQFTNSATAAQRRMEGQKWFTKCGTETTGGTATFAHEFGHHVDQFISRLDWQTRNSMFSEISTMLKEAFPEAGFSVKGSISLTADTWVNLNKRHIAKYISKYGSSNSAEFLAEIWAEYTTNPNARSHIKAIGKRIEFYAKGNKPA